MQSKTVKVTMPENRWHMAKALEGHKGADGNDARYAFLDAVHHELFQCIETALEDSCQEPSVVFSAATDHGGRQIIAEFSVSDIGRASQEQYNWHGQNTSRWCYAGAIVYDKEDGHITRHH